MSNKNNKKLVQTVVPARIHRWILKEADREGESVSSWLRRMLIRLERQHAKKGAHR